jgi:hypothetical protein
MRGGNMSENSNNSLIKHFSSRLEWELSRFLDLFPLTPRDFSWKVRWRMRYDRNPLFIVVQDKYRVKEFAKECGVKSAEVYFVTDKPETILFDSLPDNYFIKANHGCKWNILCKDRELYLYSDGEDLVGRKNISNNKMTREECVQYMTSWVNTIYSKREWAYHYIAPKIIVEEALVQYSGGELVDYRCFTFNGKVKAVYVDSATTSIYHQKIFVDSNWRELAIKNPNQTRPFVLPEKPENFQEIIDAAERLGKDLDFVRADFYNTTRGVILGEMSIYPMGGVSMQPTPDARFNKWLGDQWALPKI